eukprot:753474-Hanusia_phi.AAC.5
MFSSPLANQGKIPQLVMASGSGGEVVQWETDVNCGMVQGEVDLPRGHFCVIPFSPIHYLFARLAIF